VPAELVTFPSGWNLDTAKASYTASPHNFIREVRGTIYVAQNDRISRFQARRNPSINRRSGEMQFD
jgi:hypothetical protein